MIIAFGYKARSGKDTAAEFLIHQYGFKRIAFADALKHTTAAAFGLSDEQVFGDQKLEVDPFWGVTPASLLQTVGTELFRDNVDEDHWVRVVMRAIDAEPGANWVIPDCRFPNEAEAVKARGGIVIRVDRDADKRGDVARNASHASEVSMDEYTDWDWILDNNGAPQHMYEQLEVILADPHPVINDAAGGEALLL